MNDEPSPDSPVPGDGVPSEGESPDPAQAGGGGQGGDGGVELNLEEDQDPEFKEPELRLEKTSFSIENVRAQVARALVAVLAVVVLFSFLTLWLLSPPPGIDDLEKLLTIVFGPLIALVSGAVGYYFGGKTQESQGENR